MWIFTRYGFFSIASPGDTVTVRARFKQHLQNLQSRFPSIASAEIAGFPDRDCRCQIVIAKSDWTAIAAALAEEQTGVPNSADALQLAWNSVYGPDRADRQRVLVQRSDDGAILNADDLTADDVAEEKVLCPACRRKVFVSWPEGWDAHAAFACAIPGATPEERKANFKDQYRRLFR